jgi:hypothetical protein
MEASGVTTPRRRNRSNPRRRIFTLEHASRTLPLVKRIIADIVRQYKKVCALEEKCHMRRPNVSAEEQETLRRSYTIELGRLRELAQELSAVGCELKDWRSGLVDFRAMHEGREVELCWRLGEEKIEYWHEISNGFDGRQPIEENFGSPRPAETAGSAG